MRSVSGTAAAPEFLPQLPVLGRFRLPGIGPIRTHHVLLLGITLFALGLRFYALGDLPLFHDEAYYWVWAQHARVDHDLSFYDHPPGVAYLLAFSEDLFGSSEFGVRAVFALIGTLTVPLLYVVARQFVDRRIAMLSAFLLAVDFGHILLSRMAFNDAPTTFLFVVFLVAMSKALFDRDRRWLLVAGLILGVGFLTKYTFLVALPGVLLFVWARPAYRPHLFNRTGVVAFLLFALFTLPVLVWNAQHGWASFDYQGSRGSPFSALFTGEGGFAANFFLGLGIYPFFWFIAMSVPLTLLLLAGMFSAVRWHWTRQAVLLVIAGVLLLMVSGAMGLGDLGQAIAIVALLAGFVAATRSFTSDRDGLLVILAGTYFLWFMFSLGRLPHWTLPALGPLTILGAKYLVNIYPKVRLSTPRLSAYACVTMLLIVYVPAYAANSAASMGGHQAPDPKSIFGPAWVSASGATRPLGEDVAAALEDHPGAIVVVPNWVTYSPVAYYLHREGVTAGMATYDDDYQIGQVWGRSFDRLAEPPPTAIMAQYGSSFLDTGFDDAGLVRLLLYDNGTKGTWFYGHDDPNDWTTYARTGYDSYTVLTIGRLNWNFTAWGGIHEVSAEPYVVVLARRTGSANVTLVFDGVRYEASKDAVQYPGSKGPDWNEIFTATPIGE